MLWNSLPTLLSYCQSMVKFKSSRIKHFGAHIHDKLEKKAFFEFSSEYNKQTPCFGITLGVGDEINNELELLRHFPNCKLHGADPIETVGNVFAKVGMYHNIAVSNTSGVFSSSVLHIGERMGKKTWTYSPQNVSTVSMLDFFVKFVKQKMVHFFFMDNEGHEHRILWQFAREGVLKNHGITVCQLNVELHAPLVRYGSNPGTLKSMMLFLLTKSPYLPFEAKEAVHMRMFFVDMEHSTCCELFYDNWN